MLVYESDSHFS